MGTGTSLAAPGVPSRLFPHHHEERAALFPEERIEVVDALKADE